MSLSIEYDDEYFVYTTDEASAKAFFGLPDAQVRCCYQVDQYGRILFAVSQQ